MRPDDQEFMAQSATAKHGSLPGTRFALTKFRPSALPATLITRSALHARLAEGAGRRLTVVVGSVISRVRPSWDETRTIVDSSAGEREKCESAPGPPTGLAAQSPGLG